MDVAADDDKNDQGLKKMPAHATTNSRFRIEREMEKLAQSDVHPRLLEVRMLRRLNRIANRYEARGNYTAMADMIELAAKIVGGFYRSAKNRRYRRRK